MQKPKKLRKIKNKHLIYFLILIMIAFLIYYVWDNYTVMGKKQIYTSFIASSNIGFDLNPEALTFGKVQPGQSATRDLIIKNEFDKKVKITIKAEGEIEKYISVSENNFYLKPGEETNITFTAHLPNDLEIRKYEGKINIFQKRF